jgi:hypothetical protein
MSTYGTRTIFLGVCGLRPDPAVRPAGPGRGTSRQPTTICGPVPRENDSIWHERSSRGMVLFCTFDRTELVQATRYMIRHACYMIYHLISSATHLPTATHLLTVRGPAKEASHFRRCGHISLLVPGSVGRAAPWAVRQRTGAGPGRRGRGRRRRWLAGRRGST